MSPTPIRPLPAHRPGCHQRHRPARRHHGPLITGVLITAGLAHPWGFLPVRCGRGDRRIAYREELVSRNVAKMVRVERPKVDAKEPLSVEEARKLLTATRDDDDYALWVVMLMLGLRRSEVCGLRWDNVDLDGRTLSVTQSVQRVDGELRELPTKTRRSTRTIPLPALAVDALVRHRDRTATSSSAAPGPVYVFGTRFGTPMEPRDLTRKWTRLAEREGIRRVPLHALRHSCVSLLLSRGVNPRTVMEIVGHSALEMTMNVYGHVNLDTQTRALDELDQSLR